MLRKASRVQVQRVLPWVVFALCSVLAVYSRFHLLGRESIWLDEAITWKRAHLEFPALVANCISRLHNPSYFLFMHVYLNLGDDEVMMRLPSAVLGAATLLLTAGAGYVCGGYRVALGSMLFLAMSPLRLRYDQEARMYAQYGFSATIMMCGLLWLLLHPEQSSRPLLRLRPNANHPGHPIASTTARLAFFAVWLGGTLAWYSHNTAALLLFCAGLSVLLTLPLMPVALRLPWLANYAAVNLLILIAYTPWLSPLLKQTKRLHERFWATFPTAAELRKTFFDLYLFGGRRASLCLLTLALVGVALWTLRHRKQLLIPLLILSFVTPAILLLISLERPMFIARLMLWTVMPFSIFLAIGLASFRWPLFWTLFAGLLLVGADNAHGAHYGIRHKPDYRAAVRAMASYPRAMAIVADDYDETVLQYYTGRNTRPIAPLKFYKVTRDKLYVIPVHRVLGDAETVFLAHWRKWPALAPISADLRRRGRKIRSQSYGHGLRVDEFRMRMQGTP